MKKRIFEKMDSVLPKIYKSIGTPYPATTGEKKESSQYKPVRETRLD